MSFASIASAMRSAHVSAVATLIPPGLLATARRYNPSAAGVAMIPSTDPAPADSPMIVTLPGSPPKSAMLSRIERCSSAVSWVTMAICARRLAWVTPAMSWPSMEIR